MCEEEVQEIFLKGLVGRESETSRLTKNLGMYLYLIKCEIFVGV